MQARTIKTDLDFLNAVIDELNHYKKANTSLKKNRSGRYEDVKNIAACLYEYAGMDVDIEAHLSKNIDLPPISAVNNDEVKKSSHPLSTLVNKIEAILTGIKTGLTGKSSLRNNVKPHIIDISIVIQHLLDQKQQEEYQASLIHAENEKQDIFKLPHELLTHAFTFTDSSQSRELLSVSRHFYAAAKPVHELSLKNKMRSYFDLSHEELESKLDENNGSFEDTYNHLKQTHGRTFFLIHKWSVYSPATSLNQYTSEYTSPRNSELHRLFKSQLFSSIEQLLKEERHILNDDYRNNPFTASSPGQLYIIEIQLPISKVKILIDENKIDQLAKLIKNAYLYNTGFATLGAPAAVEYVDGKFVDKPAFSPDLPRIMPGRKN